jgi:hypothetical protein
LNYQHYPQEKQKTHWVVLFESLDKAFNPTNSLLPLQGIQQLLNEDVLHKECTTACLLTNTGG